jgi:hypothetical protein
MSTVLRRDLPILVAAILGLWIIAEYYINVPLIGAAASQLKIWGVLIYSISTFLGLINMTVLNAKNVEKKVKGEWYYNLYSIVLCYVMIAIGIAMTSNSGAYMWLMNNIYAPCRTTLYALTGFYIFSAAYRAFRVSTKEATVMLAVGILVMLSIVPVGPVIWPGFGQIGSWLLDVGQLGVSRGVGISVSIGLKTGQSFLKQPPCLLCFLSLHL